MTWIKTDFRNQLIHKVKKKTKASAVLKYILWMKTITTNNIGTLHLTNYKSLISRSILILEQWETNDQKLQQMYLSSWLNASHHAQEHDNPSNQQHQDKMPDKSATLINGWGHIKSFAIPVILRPTSLMTLLK